MEQTVDLFNGDEINFDGIRNWLSENYFKHGGRYDTAKLIEVATGEELNPKYWMEFISRKHNV
jgi:carboxypeptidase Taq